MERKKYLFILAILFSLMSISMLSQNNRTIYQAYSSGNMTKWKYAMDSIENNKHKTDKTILDLINYQYGYIAWCIGNNNDDEAEKYLEKATENLQKMEQRKNYESMLFAYKAAFVGFKIGLAQYKAPFIGPKSLEYAKKSVKLDPSNAMGYLQLGNIAYYTPSIFGGSKVEALEYYLKAFNIMESSREYKTNNWNYLNLLATIISAYIDFRQYEEAKKYCLKALAIEPDFEWVKNSLLSKILKK